MSSSDPTVSTALLSYGMSGRVFHGPLLAVNPGFTVKKILKRSSASSESLFPDAVIVRSMDDILRDGGIDLVIVNTPNDTHFPHALASLKAGKHVVVEKPFTVTLGEAEELIREAQKRGLLLTVFQNRRLDGDSLTVEKIIREGRLGRLVEYEAHYDRYRPAVDSSSWKEGTGPGSGILYNLGSHLIDQALHLFGMPSALDARVGRQRPGAKTDDYFDIRMEYDGLLVILKSSYLVCEPGPRYILHGETGSFVKYGLDPQEQMMKEGKLPQGADWGADRKENWGKLTTWQADGIRSESVPTVPGNYAAFYSGLHKALVEGSAPPVTAEEGLGVIRVINACYESAQLRKSVGIEGIWPGVVP